MKHRIIRGLRKTLKLTPNQVQGGVSPNPTEQMIANPSDSSSLKLAELVNQVDQYQVELDRLKHLLGTESRKLKAELFVSRTLSSAITSMRMDLDTLQEIIHLFDLKLKNDPSGPILSDNRRSVGISDEQAERFQSALEVTNGE